MSVMLATVNPDAAERIGNPVPMPRLGSIVKFHMREMRAGRQNVPGIVLSADADNRKLKLLIVFDHLDMMTLDVPERVGDDQGWELAEGDAMSAISALESKIDALTQRFDNFLIELSEAIYGQHDKPAVSFEDRLRAMSAEIATMKKAKTK